MSFDSANNKGGIQGHSQGDYFPVTIKTIGNHSGSEPVFTHVVLYGGAESCRFASFTSAEAFAIHVKQLIDEVDSDYAIEIVKNSAHLGLRIS